MAEHSGRQLVEKYLFEAHTRMDPTVLAEIFHPDVVLNVPGQIVRGLARLEAALTTITWPTLVPGTVHVDLVFLPLAEGDLQKCSEDSSQLLRFRAKIQATRKQPDENGGLVFSHEVTNVWKIVNGKCVETWPSFHADMNDKDVMARATAAFEE